MQNNVRDKKCVTVIVVITAIVVMTTKTTRYPSGMKRGLHTPNTRLSMNLVGAGIFRTQESKFSMESFNVRVGGGGGRGYHIFKEISTAQHPQ